MYESPITRITEDIMKDLVNREEGYLVESVHKVGFDIDKEELAKALRYDRDQYEKGFYDGRLSAQQWIPVTERLPETVERFTDAENVLAHDDGTFEFFGVFTEYESDPVLVEGIAEGEHGIFTAIYSMLKYEDGAVETEWLDNIIGDIEIKNVTAWMPLPKPWKGGAE